MTERIIIKSGEDLLRILAKRGETYRLNEVLAMPENEPLFRTRNPEILHEGDILHLPPKPEQPVRWEKLDNRIRQRFALTEPMRQVEIRPWSYLDISLEDSATFKTKGWSITVPVGDTISFEMPIRIGKLLMSIGSFQMELCFGELDPAHTLSGIQVRLSGLGYNCGGVDGNFGVRTTSAIRAFQLDNELLPDGEVGHLTLKALHSAFGV